MPHGRISPGTSDPNCKGPRTCPSNESAVREIDSYETSNGSERGTTYSNPSVGGALVEGHTMHFHAERIVGNGSFGVVFQASVVETGLREIVISSNCFNVGEVVAIKKVLQDKRFKNRELQIMRHLAKHPHPNVMRLRQCFYSTETQSNGSTSTPSNVSGQYQDVECANLSSLPPRSGSPNVYLNLVLDYMPETVYSVARRWQKAKVAMPLSNIRVYVYQLCRALGQIHAAGICHRDIKPQNLLLDPETQQVKLIDFGSAKILVRGEPNVSYICSRYYRAPELIFGSTEYTTAIDIWSAGCVFAELLLSAPLFPGDSGVDQLVEIIKVLGTPTKDEIRQMNAPYTEIKFPLIRAHDWATVFRSKTPSVAVECASAFLTYDPSSRLQPLRAIAHAFFDDLRVPGAMLDDDREYPPLFNFTPLELASCPQLRTLHPLSSLPEDEPLA